MEGLGYTLLELWHGELPWELEKDKEYEGSSYFSDQQLADMAKEREEIWKHARATGIIPNWLQSWHEHVRELGVDDEPCYKKLHELLGSGALAEKMSRGWRQRFNLTDLPADGPCSSSAVSLSDSSAAAVCCKRSHQSDESDSEGEVESQFQPAKKLKQCASDEGITWFDAEEAPLTAAASENGSEEDLTAFHSAHKRSASELAGALVDAEE